MLLTLALAAYVYYQDRRSGRTASLALLAPTLWMMRCASRSIDAWLSGGDAEFAAGRLDPIFMAGLIAWGLAILSGRRVVWSGLVNHSLPLFAFFGYLGLSALWASHEVGNPYIKLIRPFGDLVMALVVVTEPNPRESIQLILRRCAILLIPLSITLIRYYPWLGRGQAKHWGSDPWIGVTTHKNPLGQLCMISVMAFVWSILESRKGGRPLVRLPVIRIPIDWVYLAMTAYLLNGGGHSRSSTAFTCIVLGGVIFLFLEMHSRFPAAAARKVVAAAILTAVAAVSLDIAGISPQALVAQIQGKEANLTGRTWLWEDAIRLGMEHPLTGAGYGSFWVPSVYERLSPEVDNRPAQCHNGYLETFVNLGLIGVALLVLALITSLASALRQLRVDFEYARLRFVWLVVIAILNYTEATFPRGTHVFWFLFLVVALYAVPWVAKPRLPVAAGRITRRQPTGLPVPV